MSNDETIMPERPAVISRQGRKTIVVDAFTESDAIASARSQLAPSEAIRKLGIKTQGRAGFLGIGRKPNRYELNVWVPEAEAGAIVPAFSATLDALEPQAASYSKSYSKAQVLELYLALLVQDAIGWRTYDIAGVARRHCPCTRVRWESNGKCVVLRYHCDYADGTQRDSWFEILRLPSHSFGLRDQYHSDSMGMDDALDGITGAGCVGEASSYYLEFAGMPNVIEEAISRKVFDKTFPASLLIMKRGAEHPNPSWYIEQVISTLVPQARLAKGLQVKAICNAGQVDQVTAAAAVALHFGKEAVDSKKYRILLEDFTDADGDGGFLVKVFDTRT